MDIRKIIEAWIIAYNPNEDQKKLAALRGDICEGCPSKKTEFAPEESCMNLLA